jgi:hypothetical protein
MSLSAQPFVFKANGCIQTCLTPGPSAAVCLDANCRAAALRVAAGAGTRALPAAPDVQVGVRGATRAAVAARDGLVGVQAGTRAVVAGRNEWVRVLAAIRAAVAMLDGQVRARAWFPVGPAVPDVRVRAWAGSRAVAATRDVRAAVRCAPVAGGPVRPVQRCEPAERVVYGSAAVDSGSQLDLDRVDWDWAGWGQADWTLRESLAVRLVCWGAPARSAVLSAREFQAAQVDQGGRVAAAPPPVRAGLRRARRDSRPWARE